MTRLDDATKGAAAAMMGAAAAQVWPDTRNVFRSMAMLVRNSNDRGAPASRLSTMKAAKPQAFEHLVRAGSAIVKIRNELPASGGRERVMRLFCQHVDDWFNDDYKDTVQLSTPMEDLARKWAEGQGLGSSERRCLNEHILNLGIRSLYSRDQVALNGWPMKL